MNEQELIQKYLDRASINKLLTEYPQYNRSQITRILTDNKITIRGGRSKKQLTEEQIATVKQMIADGAFFIDIAKYLNLAKETARLRLRELGIEMNNQNRVNRRIKSDYFSNIDSPIKAYWLGFLFTDGSVDHYHKTGRIRLQLQERDLEILEKFKEDLSLDCKIIYDIRENSTCCSVEFNDEQMFNDLAKYNIIPQKTYKIDHIPYEKIPEEYLSAYALGLYNGDGSLSCSANYSTDVSINYTSYSENEVKDFQTLINQLCNIEKTNKNFFTSAWHTQWRGRLQVIKILDKLYENNPRYLKRKHDKYLSLKESLN